MLATARLTGMTGGATIAALVFRAGAAATREHLCLLIAVGLAVAGGAGEPVAAAAGGRDASPRRELRGDAAASSDDR